MRKNLHKHHWYYISFIAIQIVGGILTYVISSDKNAFRWMVVGTTGVYSLFAILHQYLHHHLTPKIVVEYVLIGLVGITMSFYFFNL